LEHLFGRGGIIAKDAVTWVHRAKTLIYDGKQNAADSVQKQPAPIKSSTKASIGCGELTTMVEAERDW
jgi:hypothetical protein